MGLSQRMVILFVLLFGLLTGCALDGSKLVPVQNRVTVVGSADVMQAQWQDIFESLAANNVKLQKEIIRQLVSSKVPDDAIKLALIYELGDNSVKNSKQALALINKYSSMRDELSDYSHFAMFIINNKQRDSIRIKGLSEKIISNKRKDSILIEELRAKIDALKSIESSMSQRP